MALFSRLKRRLGYDTTFTKTARYPRYQYTITYPSGNADRVEAHTHKWETGTLKLYSADTETWAAATTHYRDMACKPGFGLRGYDAVGEFRGVQDMNREQVGETVFEFVIDWADHSLVSVDRSEE